MRKAQGLKRLGPGKYRVTVVRTHPTELRKDGKPLKVKRKRTIEGPRHEAERAHDELAIELEIELGIRPAPIRLTLTDYATQWLSQRARRLAHSTIAKYMNDLEKHILPALGDRMLDELRPSDIRAMLAQDNGADNSRKNRLRLLSAMSKDALADDLIARDFCLRVTVKVAPVYDDEEPNLLSPGELAALLHHFELLEGPWLDAVYLLAFTGMRWCEVAGLQWDDIDLTKGVMRIKRGNVKGHIGKTKTDASRRTVGLVDEVVDRLKARRQRMLAEQHPGLRKGWVFPRLDGEHYRGYPLIKALYRACKAAGIPIRFTTHGLRRTYNDLARRHVDGQVVRAIVGHSSEAMTAYYSRVDIGEKRAASRAVLDSVKANQPHPDRDPTPPSHTTAPEVTQKVTPDVQTPGVKIAKT